MIYLLRLVLLCIFLPGAMLLAGEDVLRPSTPAAGDVKHKRSDRPPVQLGFDLGATFNTYSGDAEEQLSGTRGNLFEAGSGLGGLLDIYADIPVSESIGIQASLGVDAKSFSDDSNTYSEDCTLADLQTVTANLDNEYDATVTYVALAGLLRVNVTPEWQVYVGPNLQFKIGDAEFESTDHINSPDECFFIDDAGFLTDQKSQTQTDIDDQASSTRLALEIGTGYLIPLSEGVWLVPKAGAQLFLSSFGDDISTFSLDSTALGNITNRTLHSIQFTIGLLFDL